MDDFTKINDLDNNLSLLYKQAVKLNVPLRYLLIKPSERRINDVSDIINRSKEDVFKYNTIFEFIAQHDGMTTTYNIIKQFLGPQLYVIDYICAYIKVKGFTIDQLPELQDLLQVNDDQKILRDYDAVMNQYATWTEEYQSELQKDILITKKLYDQQMALYAIDPLPNSGLEIDSITFMYDIKVPYNNLKDVFVSAKLSYVCPFIQYVDVEGNKTFRVFKGDNEDHQLDYSHINIQQSTLMKRECLYVKMWSNEISSRSHILRESTKESFQIVTINYLDSLGVLRIRLTSPYKKNIDKSDLIRRLHACVDISLPDPNTIVENKLLGTYTVYDVDIQNEIFHYLVLNHPIFNQYLYIEESSTKSLPAKTRMNVNYRPSFLEASLLSREKKRLSTKSPLVASCFRELFNAGRTILWNGSEVTLQKDVLGVRFKINRAASIDLAEQFINITSRLMNLYKTFHNKGIQLYNSYIPEYNKVVEYSHKYKTINEVKVKSKDINARQGGPSDNLQILQSKAPDIFVTKYARECMKNLQPIILEEDEVEEFEKKTFLNKMGEVTNYKVMRFPVNDPKYIFACPYEYAPYVGVKVNKKLSNKDVYPYIPCCYLEDQTQKNTAYSKMISENGGSSVTLQKSYVSSSSKVQAEGRYGLIPVILTDLLSLYEEDNKNTFYRLGLKISSCSFIAAVCEALGINEDAQVVRTKLLQSVNYEITKQELYDYSKDDIISMIVNEDKYFDPLRLYRLIEVFFGVNIFLFTNRELDQYTMEYTNLFMIPRYKKMHIRNKLRYDRTICVIVNEGAEFEYPQCELIVERLPSGEDKKVFPTGMGDLLYDTYLYVCRNLSWEIYNEPDSEMTKMITRDFYYSAIDYSFLQSVKTISQVIDKYGKCRMIHFKVDNNDTDYIMYCLPCQPFDLPTFTQTDLDLPSYKEVIALFGSPSGYSDGLLSYNCGDVSHALQFAIRDGDVVKSNMNLQDIPSDLKTIHRYDIPSLGSKVVTYQKMNKMANFMKQLFVFLLIDCNYDIAAVYKYMYVLDIGSQQDRVWTFIPQRLLKQPTDDIIQTVRQWYRPELVPRVIKKGSVIETLMDALPGLFKDGKIVIEDIRMFSGIKYHLLTFLQKNNNSDFAEYAKQKYYIIHDYYKIKSDYPNRENEFLLLSDKEYKSWEQKYVNINIIHQRSVNQIQQYIQTTLKYSDYQIREPFPYYQPYNSLVGPNLFPAVDSYYMIQSVAEGSLYRAINLCYIWFKERRNSGFFCPAYPERDKLPSYKIYFINQSGQLSIKEDHSLGDAHLMVLEYTTDTYGAILPLE